MVLLLRYFSHDTSDGRKWRKNRIYIFKKENCHIDLLYKIIDTDLKKVMSLEVFPQQEC